ncbi:hypothetical protein [Streptomyces coffeae]|uniref:Uncharacterized protein n=1 Tax=Streptomyces coffeae TaxID=621382 RepID=A0ABS1NP27_9ACTN|nr:hypothetical protein [Streptomyces coffeae]MBL1101715.1 hypothetical protein [Streptomyces coffeae]
MTTTANAPAHIDHYIGGRLDDRGATHRSEVYDPAIGGHHGGDLLIGNRPGPPDRAMSRRPAMRCSANRARQRPTACGVEPS